MPYNVTNITFTADTIVMTAATGSRDGSPTEFNYVWVLTNPTNVAAAPPQGPWKIKWTEGGKGYEYNFGNTHYNWNYAGGRLTLTQQGS
jgi:hypothetical protein